MNKEQFVSVVGGSVSDHELRLLVPTLQDEKFLKKLQKEHGVENIEELNIVYKLSVNSSNNIVVEIEENQKLIELGLIKEDYNNLEVGRLDRIEKDDKVVMTPKDFVEYTKAFNKIDIDFLKTEKLDVLFTITLSGKKDYTKELNLNIEESGIKKTDLEERVNYLEALGLNEKLKANVLRQIKLDNKDLPEEIFNRIPKFSDFYIQQKKELSTILAAYVSRSNILLEGPHASGKNTLIEQVAAIFNQPLFEIQISGDIDVTSILGMKTIEPVVDYNDKETETKIKESVKLFFKAMKNPELLEQEEFGNAAKTVIESLSGGETQVVYERSPLVQAMEYGGIVVLDEINTGHPSILSILNSILDDRNRIDIPGYKSVKAHPNFRVFATMNKGYAGTLTMNAATQSRFLCVPLTPPKTISEVLIKAKPNISNEILEDLENIYTSILNGTLGSEATLSPESLNVRSFKTVIELIDNGLDKETAYYTIPASAQDDFERTALELIIDTVIS